MQQQLSFTNHQGEQLAATLHTPDPTTDYGAILGHCFTCSRHTQVLRQISEGLCTRGFFVLRFDFSGNGQSEGNFADSTYSKQISEMKSAASFLQDRGVSWLGLVGHSMGAMVALLAAAQMDSVQAVCSLAARSRIMGPADLFDAGNLQELQQTGAVSFLSRGRQLQLTEQFFADAARYDLNAIMPSLRQYVLLVHGDQDEIIPAAEAHRLQQLRPHKTELAIIERGDHMFSQDEQRQQAAELVVGWFHKLRLQQLA
ncbi:MAG: alpha/beta hydrolase [Deltaproteobacteria bacterium]|nr:alpha/beta hydrolase [Deltaproteobacteria bacterium]